MIGIYKITNKLNGKFYIGQSNNIERRFSEHCQNKLKNRIPLDTAIQKYGKENFKLEVIQECNISDLNKWESYWIEQLDAINKGYNCNPGGDNAQLGSYNSNSKIIEEDVILIRTSYNNHLKQKEIYHKYFINKISFGHFQNIWQGKSWAYIMPEVFTEENKQYYIYENSIGSNSSYSSLTDEEVLKIRTRYINESAKEIYEDYKDKIKLQTLQAILWGRTYTNVPVYSKKKKQWINK